MNERPEQHHDSGFTLPELLIVVLMTGIVMVVLFASLTSVTKATARTDARTQTLNETRRAIETISRDLRAANPIDAVTPVSDYDKSVQFDVFCKTGTANCIGNLRGVQYRLHGSTLERVVGGAATPLVGPQGSPTLATGLRRGAVLNGSDPVFTYFDGNGSKLETAGDDAAPATSFRDCAKTVRIHLKVRADAGDPNAVVDITTSVALRNYNEVLGC